MGRSPFGAVARRVPAVARRDARIAELTERLTIAGEQLEELRRAEARAATLVDPRRPSFFARHEALKRAWAADRGVQPVDPRRRLLGKLTSYELARSHGVAPPELYGVWDDPDAITWDALPEAFVLKTNRGASSRGVYPVRREGDLFRVTGEADAMDAEGVAAVIHRMRATGRVSYPVFAEEWLTPAGGDAAFPHDVKLYAFYGVVGMVLLREVSPAGLRKPVQVRYLSREGEDLGRISEDRSIAEHIPPPAQLPALVEAAERLSAAVPAPFLRVDLYETARGVVFGEFTPVPGNVQNFGESIDELLGGLWEDAELRVARDLRATGVFDLRFGAGAGTADA